MADQVSGPGKFSKRTDKAVSAANQNLPNADYGEQASYQAQKGAAPEAHTPSGVSFSDMFGNPSDRVVGFDQPTNQPNTPVTDGAAAGAGAGPEALGLPNQSQQDLESLLPNLPVLEFMANQPGASWAMRNLVRKAKALQ